MRQYRRPVACEEQVVLLLCLVVSCCLVTTAATSGDDRKIRCNSPFGSVCGTTSSGVVAYSNCRSFVTSHKNAYYNGTYTGMKWQCVEFARRYWLQVQGVVFGSVDGAYQIFTELTNVTRPGSDRVFPMRKHANTQSVVPPSVGDLIVYPVQPGGFPYGHVCAVVEVGSGYVRVAEQNWANAPWGGRAGIYNYARQLQLQKLCDKSLAGEGGDAPRCVYSVVDRSYQVAGWIGVEA